MAQLFRREDGLAARAAAVQGLDQGAGEGADLVGVGADHRPQRQALAEGREVALEQRPGVLVGAQVGDDEGLPLGRTVPQLAGDRLPGEAVLTDAAGLGVAQGEVELAAALVGEQVPAEVDEQRSGVAGGRAQVGEHGVRVAGAGQVHGVDGVSYTHL